jgi:hypothetical protein
MAPPEEQTNRTGSVRAAAEETNSAAEFVAKFTSHYRVCLSLAKRFTGDCHNVKDSAAISQLCRSSQEMLEQAKEARTLTEIYLALDECHRDIVRPIITGRFRDIEKLARASWLRLGDSIKIGQMPKPEIEAAQQDLQLHSDRFQEAIRAFIAMSASTN